MPCTLLHRPDQVSGALLASDLSSPTPRLLDSILTAPSRERCNSQRRRHPKTSTCRSPITTPPSPRSEASSLLELQVPDGTASASSDRKSRAPGAPLPAVSTFPCSSSMGSSASELPAPAAEEMSKYSSAVARDSTSALGFPPIDGLLADVFNRTSTLKFASVAATNALTVPPASSYVAPQVFGEMPTPRFCYENYCYEHPNPTQSSRVHGGSTNLVKQNLDGMPERYGLHNLNRHSLFRADGTEHSYFTLPTDYPLERAVPEPVFAVYDGESGGCSNEFIDVFAGTSEQQPHEDAEFNKSLEKPISKQLLKCFSKATETEQTSVCLNIVTDVLDFTLELQQQEDEKATNCSVLKASNSFLTRSSQLIVEYSMKGLRMLWDPRDDTNLSSTLNLDVVGVCQTSILTTSGIFTLPYVLTMRVQFGVPTCVPQQSCYGRVPSSQENHGIQLLWDPGILKWSTLSAQHILESSMKKGSIFSTGRMFPWDPWYAILPFHHFLWEFSIDTVLGKTAVQNLVHSGLHVHMIQLMDCSTIHACYSVSALLPLTQIKAYGSGNIEVPDTKLQWDPGIRPSSSIVLLAAKFDCRSCNWPFFFVTNSRTNMSKSSDQLFLCMGPWYYVTSVHVQLVVTVHRRKGNGYTNS